MHGNARESQSPGLERVGRGVASPRRDQQGLDAPDGRQSQDPGHFLGQMTRITVSSQQGILGKAGCPEKGLWSPGPQGCLAGPVPLAILVRESPSPRGVLGLCDFVIGRQASSWFAHTFGFTANPQRVLWEGRLRAVDEWFHDLGGVPWLSHPSSYLHLWVDLPHQQSGFLSLGRRGRKLTQFMGRRAHTPAPCRAPSLRKGSEHEWGGKEENRCPDEVPPVSSSLPSSVGIALPSILVNLPLRGSGGVPAYLLHQIPWPTRVGPPCLVYTASGSLCGPEEQGIKVGTSRGTKHSSLHRSRWSSFISDL